MIGVNNDEEKEVEKEDVVEEELPFDELLEVGRCYME